MRKKSQFLGSFHIFFGLIYPCYLCFLWLNLLPSAVAAAEAALEAGFASTDVTPKVGPDTPVYMAGFGHNRIATGVHDPLLARAVVLKHGDQKIAIVAVDIIGLFHHHVAAIREDLPGFTYVLVSSTHNHEGPDTLGLWGSNPFRSGVDAAYMKTLRTQIVKAVKDADAARQEVTVRIGTATAPELLHDAREPYVKHDELAALEFVGVKTEKAVGAVVQWNCHPETLESKNKEISADFVGPAVKELSERRHCPVVYLTGTVGGLMTSMHVPVKDADGKLLADGSWEKTARYGQLVGKLADAALDKAKPIRLTPLEVHARPVFLPLYNKLYMLARQMRVVDRPAFLWTGDASKAEPAPADEGQKPLCLKTEIAWLRLGELDVVAVPGEIYPELVLDKVQDPVDPGADFPDAPIEPGLYKQLKGPYRMMVGLANDEIGYIIPKRQWDEKPPFCYGRKEAQYGEMNSVGPETAPILCKAFQELVKPSK